jgi:hypothetical protein
MKHKQKLVKRTKKRSCCNKEKLLLHQRIRSYCNKREETTETKGKEATATGERSC